jgi:hypothetical protein
MTSLLTKIDAHISFATQLPAFYGKPSFCQHILDFFGDMDSITERWS